jgi:hypothetical protein
MQARTQVNMTKIATLFTLQDKRFSGAPASGSSPFVSISDKDAKSTEDASKNWKNTPEMSFKTSCVPGTSAT